MDFLSILWLKQSFPVATFRCIVKKNQENVLTIFDHCGIIQLSSEEMTDMKILFIRRKKHVINDSLSPYAEQPVQHAKQPDE